MKFLAKGKFYIFLFVLVVFLIVWKREDLIEALILWKNLKWYFILTAVFLQLINYSSAASVYYFLLRTQGENFNFLHIFRAATVMIFLNRALPALGLSGAAFIVRRLHQDGLPRGRALIMTILYYNNFYLAFFILLFVGFFYLFLNHDLSKAHILAATGAVGIVLFIFAFIIYIVSEKIRLFLWADRFIKVLGKFNWRLKKFFTEKNEKIKCELEEVFKSWRHYWKDFRHMLLPFACSLSQHLAEIFTLYIIFRALDHPVSIWVLAVGYVSSGVLAFVTFIPNGIGIYEATMILLLNGFEVPLPVALSGVLAFRALFYWLPIPLGIYFYRHFDLLDDKNVG